jgi:predicted deacylase
MTILEQVVPPGQYRHIRHTIGNLPSGHEISLLVHVYRGKNAGPRLLLLGGLHGDEINSVEILRRSLVEGLFNPVQAGTVVIVPIVNVFGFINFSRDLPDGKDINRSFPGVATGSLAARIARFVSDELLPQADWIVDLHTGGSSRYNFPQVRLSDDIPESRELANWFGAPIAVFKPVIPKSLRALATRRQKPIIVYEAGESLRYDELSIRIGQEGIKRVMHSLGMIPALGNWNPAAQPAVSFYEHSTWVRARSAGLFLWVRAAGEEVDKGEFLGEIHDPDGLTSHPVRAPRAGRIIGHNNAAVVSLGDALFHIAW